jgi:hypothetical protein
MSINELVEKLVKEFDAQSYRIKDKNGVVIKFVKDGVEVEYENKKNNTRD